MRGRGTVLVGDRSADRQSEKSQSLEIICAAAPVIRAAAESFRNEIAARQNRSVMKSPHGRIIHDATGIETHIPDGFHYKSTGDVRWTKTKDIGVWKTAS